MPSAISGLSSTPAAVTGGTKALSSADFLNLMIHQLSNQDPLNPTDSNQLLTQMSQISNLQSNSDMQASLASLTLQQSIGAGGNLIGKTINGIDGYGNAVSGIVTSVKVIDKNVYLELDNGHDLPMKNVTQIAQVGAAQAGPSALDSLAASVPQLQKLLAAMAANSATTANAATTTQPSIGTPQAPLADGSTTSASITNLLPVPPVISSFVP